MKKSVYDENNLTWMSLGYHMERCFGSQEDVDNVYRILDDG